MNTYQSAKDYPEQHAPGLAYFIEAAALSRYTLIHEEKHDLNVIDVQKTSQLLAAFIRDSKAVWSDKQINQAIIDAMPTVPEFTYDDYDTCGYIVCDDKDERNHVLCTLVREQPPVHVLELNVDHTHRTVEDILARVQMAKIHIAALSTVDGHDIIVSPLKCHDKALMGRVNAQLAKYREEGHPLCNLDVICMDCIH